MQGQRQVQEAQQAEDANRRQNEIAAQYIESTKNNSIDNSEAWKRYEDMQRTMGAYDQQRLQQQQQRQQQQQLELQQQQLQELQALRQKVEQLERQR